MNKLDIIAMDKAILESKVNYINHYSKGGPFGAVIVKDDKIISTAHNTVIESMDPTAHAEINVIRKACKVLNTYNLKGCKLYTSAEPCPMCLSAIIWSNIEDVYYANTKNDGDNIGFRDNKIYEYLKGNNKSCINLYHIENAEALEVFKDFKDLDDETIY